MFRPLALLLLLAASPLAAQAPAAPSSPQLYLTVFRNPSSGAELRFGRLGVHAGYYPTILRADGEADGRNTNFLRFGVSVYSHPARLAAYLTTSAAISLDERFDNGILTDAGVRVPIITRVALRGGVGVLTTFDGEVRVNPTIGLDIRLGGAR